MTIRAIFFDTSDTLYRSSELKKAYREVVFSKVSKIKNISYEETKELYERTKENLKKKMSFPSKVFVLNEMGIPKKDFIEWIAGVNSSEFLKPDEKLNSVLGRLAKKFKLGVITNVNERAFTKVVSALHVEKAHFTYIVTADKVTYGKPNEEPFRKALELSRLQPEECVYAGDSLKKDIVPAKKIGMRTIWVSPDAKEDEHVDAYCSSVHNVEDALSRVG